MAWKSECSLDYLRDRMDAFYRTCTELDYPPYCLTSTLAARSNGDAQIKLRWIVGSKHKQAAPRPWTVELFLRGIDIPDKHDASHICGRGLHGCVDPSHIVIEDHDTNLDRRDCHKRTVCPCPCGVEHRVRTSCPHEPKCL